MTNGRRNLAKISQPHPGNGRGSISSLTACLGAILFIVSLVYLPALTLAQRKNPRRQPRPATRTSVDYSRFSHATEKHKGACSTCHKLPTRNWQKAGDIPDVADYPEHEACVGCHRQQFFKGARPPICAICHSKVSPRDDARFSFRNPASMRQFSIEFPHDRHQDVIARVRPAVESWKRVEFLTASFLRTQARDEKTKTYNNCVICHAGGAGNPIAPAGGWIDSFAPDGATFKAVPASHASCFNCHWSSQAPVSNDCRGCHKPATRYRAIASPTRISMKFRHGREQHVAECTACHINITKASSLLGLKPDVPITQCTECHNKDGLRLDVSKELQAVDKNAAFVCVYCHTSDIGRRDAPASHYLIAEREPIKRSGIR
jgi:Outer membrane cytochrome MtrC/MtrF-like, domains II/IV